MHDFPKSKYPVGYEFYYADYSKHQHVEAIAVDLQRYTRTWEEHIPAASLARVKSVRFDGEKVTYDIVRNNLYSTMSQETIDKRGFPTLEDALAAFDTVYPEFAKSNEESRKRHTVRTKDKSFTMVQTTGQAIVDMMDHIMQNRDTFPDKVISARFILDRLKEADLEPSASPA